MKMYWFKQLSLILLLIALAFVIDLYMTNAILSVEDVTLRQTNLALITAVIIIACNQLLYNYATVNETFMQHPRWQRMYIYIMIGLFFSFIIFMFLFSVFGGLKMQTWVMFAGIYYFIFMLNLLALSIIHKVVEANAKKKIILSGTSFILLVALTLFVF
ncbi:hypothetical protein BEP19_12350 [Ammoniphilus oxalaticus]|uniref:Uncharacterized protein n=1 Tax=Ammoniphilus oxalaticus TaxID=66863 RepID=A0A419SH03_9BACL|nr:hypothetical protein [Ammoniphilus oxalaticus]RKD23015.1 hypothetical protein BEP19_12350 [Ammoniphilus oxalaticus]